MKEFAILSIVNVSKNGLSFKEISKSFTDSSPAIRAGLKLLISKGMVEDINIGKNNYLYKSINTNYNLDIITSIDKKIDKVIGFLNSFVDSEIPENNNIEDYTSITRDTVENIKSSLDLKAPTEKEDIIKEIEKHKAEDFSINKFTKLITDKYETEELCKNSEEETIVQIEEQKEDSVIRPIDKINNLFMIDNVVVAKDIIHFFSHKTARAIDDENSFELVLPYLEIGKYSADDIKIAITNYVEAFKKSKKTWSEISTFENFFKNILPGIV